MSLPDPPPLTDSEEASLDALRAMTPSPSDADVDRIEAVLRRMRLAASGVVGESRALTDGKFAVLGLIARSQELLVGAVDAVKAHNHHVTAACLRGLTETVGAFIYVCEVPDRLPSLVSDTPPKPGKLVSAAERRVEGADSDYDWLSDAVHPGRTSLLFSFRWKGESDNEDLPIGFRFPVRDFEAEEVVESIRVAAALGEWVMKLAGELIEADPRAL